MLRFLVLFPAALLFATAAGAHESDDAPRAGLRVHVDPATGQVLDEAPPQEANAVEAARPSRRGKVDYTRMSTSSGAHGTVLINLNGQMRMYSVARVTAEGHVAEDCITGTELAHRHTAGETSAATTDAKASPEK